MKNIISKYAPPIICGSCVLALFVSMYYYGNLIHHFDGSRSYSFVGEISYVSFTPNKQGTVLSSSVPASFIFRLECANGRKFMFLEKNKIMAPFHYRLINKGDIVKVIWKGRYNYEISTIVNLNDLNIDWYSIDVLYNDEKG